MQGRATGVFALVVASPCLARHGVAPHRRRRTAQRFVPGAKSTIDGDAARHKATGCQVRTAHFADGSTLRDTPLYAPTYASDAELPADRQSIVGVNEPFEIKREAVRVVVDYRFMDSRRVVHLIAPAPVDAPSRLTPARVRAALS
jgi:hypothetical protein